MSKISQELQKIACYHKGILRPEAVVEAARPVTSPLHSSFEWDDRKGAHEYRLNQARHLIVTVYTTATIEKKPVRVQVWVSLKRDQKRPGGGFRQITAVLEDEQMKAELLSEALAAAFYFRNKYRGLEKLSKVFAAIDDLT